jgi:type IV secretory pathway VirB9-like protein
MASTSEYEQQQFWEDKPIEIILGDNSIWELTNNNNIIYVQSNINGPI